MRLSILVVAAIASIPHTALGQSRLVNGATLREIADGVISLMGYSLTPDVTTGSLSIANEPTDNPNIDITALGGGFTVSENFRLYLEGTLGRSLYDPIFLLSQGSAERSVSSHWTTVSASGGVGWDFPLVEGLKFRPMFNLSFGRVETDGSLVGYALDELTEEEIEFLLHGTLNVLGVGGTLMLDYEHYLAEGEVDVELRYTYINLDGTSGSAAVVEGSSSAQSASLWARWRAPTGLQVLDRPLRYVLEAAHTQFFDDLRGVLGFTGLSSLGVGLELDTGAHDIFVTRARLLVRYQFGGDVEGTSVGFAVSF